MTKPESLGWREGDPTLPEDIVAVLDKWSKKGSNRDKRFIAISGALRDGMIENSSLWQSVEYMIRVHREPFDWTLLDTPGENDDQWGNTSGQDFSHASLSTGFAQPLPYPEYGANTLHRGFWHVWRMNREMTGWPEKFIDPDHCRWAVNMVANNAELLNDVAFNAAWRPIQTTHQQRIMGTILTLKAQQGRIDRPANIFSVGHSLGTGEKKLLMGMDFPTPSVYEWLEDVHGHSGALRSVNIGLSSQLDAKLTNLPPVASVYAMDLFPGDMLSDAREWAVSSLMPSEQMNRDFMNEVEYLNAKQPDDYHSLRGNFANPQAVDYLKEIMPNKADVVLFSTIWYQLSRADRQNMLNNALSILSDDGLVLVQDFIDLRPQITPTGDPIDELHFPHKWSRWSYRMHVLDPAAAGWDINRMKFRLAMQFIDGRCGGVHFSSEYKTMLFS
jgi:hypothetical protein